MTDCCGTAYTVSRPRRGGYVREMDAFICTEFEEYRVSCEEVLSFFELVLDLDVVTCDIWVADMVETGYRGEL
jgi:hypothetical protein